MSAGGQCTACAQGAHHAEMLPSGARTRRGRGAERKHTTPRGNQAALSDLKPRVVQTNLRVSEPGDSYEREADRVAESVMRMPARSGLAGDPPAISSFSRSARANPAVQRRCAACDKEDVQRKETGGGEVAASVARPRGAGQPLPPATRRFFEPRFGYDFAGVRIHTGTEADRSARDLNALAYTAGSDIVFANGQFDPVSRNGQKLLAHELTHVVQQRDSGAQVQRLCGSRVPATAGCVTDPGIPVPTEKFLFDVNCDDFAPGEEARLAAFVAAVAPGSMLRVVGLASSDGPSELNERLSCSRATKGETVVRASLPATVSISSVGATGEVPGTDNDPTLRAVGIGVATPPPTPVPPPVVKPGPRTPCERDCASDFDECVARSMTWDRCLARRNACLSHCTGSAPAFEVCARLLQPPVEISGCNHSYVETPTKRYAIQTLCTPSWYLGIGAAIATKTDRSPDPCHRRPTCLPCTPAPGVTDVEACLAAEFAAYPAPAEHHLLGPNSNTFASTLARRCCAGFGTTPPAAFGCVPGWGMGLPAARPGTVCPASPAC